MHQKIRVLEFWLTQIRIIAFRRYDDVLILAAAIFFSFNSGYRHKPALPNKNKLVLEYAIKKGPSISPTYEQAVCTELVIGILKHFITLSQEDKKRIRIITSEDIYALRKTSSPVPKGVYYALTANGTGTAIDSLRDVRPGDFVQFWYEHWGHCGIVKSLDTAAHSMELYSSFPSTNGFGIQSFDIPEEAWFVRLNES